MIFPLVLAAIYGAQFSRATELPGFPEVDSFLQFILPASILQGVAFNAGDAGTGMATDIQNGFFDRLMSSPTSRLAVSSAVSPGRLCSPQFSPPSWC